MPPADGPLSETNTLKEALRAIRRRRGMSAREVAAAMGLALRTYQHFEAGRGQLNFERIKAFALATDSDPHAILTAVMIGTASVEGVVMRADKP